MKSKDFILEVFKIIEEKKIKYGILRKIDEIIQGEAHDIDMVIDFERINELENILEEVAIKFGWKRIMSSDKDMGNLKTIHYAYWNKEIINIVHFDLFKTFSWNGHVLLTNKELLCGIEKTNLLFGVSKENEIVIKLLSRLVYHGYIKDEYILEIFKYIENNMESICKKLRGIIGNENTIEIIDIIKQKDWEKTRPLMDKIRKYFLKQDSKFLVFKRLGFNIKRYFKHKGIMIAFIGTDGSGKSTIIDKIPEKLENTFNKNQVKYYHWRPGILKSPKGNKSGSREITNIPHKQKSYNKLVSLFKFLYFNMDFVLGYWLSVKKHLGKNEIVIFDRYYYDYYVDKYRYRLDVSDRIIFTFNKIIPKPDITFLLVGDSEILYNRKKELPIEEMERQLLRIREIKDIISNSTFIDVNKNIEIVSNNVSSKILEHMAERWE